MKYKILVQILEKPNLVEAVQALDGKTFRKIIQHVGLEDSADLVSLASTTQLQEVFDEDLWKNLAPGEEEKFNDERFSLWLEVLMEVGSKFAAQKIAEMDEDFVSLGLSKLVFVLDNDEIADEARRHEDEDSLGIFEKILDGTLSQELNSYLIVARRNKGWDAVMSLLTSLDDLHPAVLERILKRCYYASMDLINDNGGLMTVLSEGDMLESDASAEREERREQEGYVAPSSAKGFLRLIEQTPLEKILTEEPDHITKMYFRGFKGTPLKPVSAGNQELLALLKAQGVVKDQAPKLLGTGASGLPIRGLLRELLIKDATAHAQRLLELNYLANIVLAGVSNGRDRYRPVEAMDEALKICNEGLVELQKRGAFKENMSLVVLFKFGWKMYKQKE